MPKKTKKQKSGRPPGLSRYQQKRQKRHEEEHGYEEEAGQGAPDVLGVLAEIRREHLERPQDESAAGKPLKPGEFRYNPHYYKIMVTDAFKTAVGVRIDNPKTHTIRPNPQDRKPKELFFLKAVFNVEKNKWMITRHVANNADELGQGQWSEEEIGELRAPPKKAFSTLRNWAVAAGEEEGSTSYNVRGLGDEKSLDTIHIHQYSRLPASFKRNPSP